MDFHIKPKHGFLEIPLGIQREDLRALFSNTPFTKKALPWEIGESDYYDEHDLRFSYDEKECLTSIGFTSDTSVFLRTIRFRKRKLKRVISDLKSLSFVLIEDKDDEVLFNDDLGLAIFTDDKKIEAFELYSGAYIEIRNMHASYIDEFLQDDEKDG